MVWVSRAGVGLAILLVVAMVATLLAGTYAARRGFPLHDGEQVVPALDAQVEVLRDARGVPTIVAADADDLFRAQGYVHAQDRFWEMDFRRHVTAGRLAELFGESQLDADRFVRTLGWRRVAEAELDGLDPETLAALEAYAEGVNAWMDGRRRARLSFEHALLPLAGARGYEPEPWTPADSVAWLKAMAWDLRANMEAELERGRLLAYHNRERIGELFPPFPHDRHTPIIPAAEIDRAGAALDPLDAAEASEVSVGSADDGLVAALGQADDALARTQDALTAMPALLGPRGDGIGSNSWVVAPERSATGTALLANDPHLGPSQPSLWYQVALRCEPVTDACPYRVNGFSFSGFPGVIIGHNDHIAWGFTSLGADVSDLFIERVDGDAYLTADGWVDMDVRTETIEVAGSDPVEVTIRSTRHGPLLSDVSDGAADLTDGPLVASSPGPSHAVALSWTALEPGRTADALLPLNRARDFEEFRAAASRFDVPAQNLVYADVDGHIGYQAPGLIPIRRNHDGRYPVLGWTGEHGWDGYVDFEDLPWLLDPDEGIIVTANQVVAGPDVQTPFHAEGDADAGYRAQRIRDLLGDRDELTLDDLAEIQLDEHNANAAHLVPYLLDADVPAEVAGAQALLDGWDLQDDADSAAAAFFNATWRHLLALTFHNKVPEWADPSGGSRWWEVVRNLTAEPNSFWWDDPGSDERETRDDILRQAMIDAHAELEARLGDDVAEWRWGALHTLTLTHESFGRSGIDVVEWLFNRGPVELGGGTSILNATGWTAHAGYEVMWVPSMRMLVDLGDLDAGGWIHLTGQSGRPFHPYYTDQLDDWAAGRTHPIAFSDGAVEAATVDRLTLIPGER